MRTWHNSIPMKILHDELGLYQGVWSSQMDHYWESSDGYTVSSRQIRTPLGTVEHLAIERIDGGDLPWAVKQEIKDELFGSRAVAIEVYPAKKNGRYLPPLGAAEGIPASVRYSSYPRSTGNSRVAWI